MMRQKEFITRESALTGQSIAAVRNRIEKGYYNRLKFKKVNRRVVLIEPGPIARDWLPRAGEIPMKAFVQDLAEKLGQRPHTVYVRLSRQGWPGIKVRRVNQRLAYVQL